MAFEGIVDFRLDRLQTDDIVVVFRLERVEHGLAGARSVDMPLDAVARDQVLEAKAGGDDADGADDRAGVGVDLVSGTGEPVASGCGHVLREGEDGNLLFIGKLPDRPATSADWTGEPPGELI